MSDRGLRLVKQIAKEKGIKGDINISNAKGKRFNIRVDGKLINFGSYPYSKYGAYIDHRDEDIRNAWRARHEKILLKDGKPAYKDKHSAEFYSYHLLWP
jgi:hypothetical protein